MHCDNNKQLYVGASVLTRATLLKAHKQKKHPLGVFVYCGKEGIRTPDTFSYTRFPSVRLKPLGHLSKRVTKLRNAF